MSSGYLMLDMIKRGKAARRVHADEFRAEALLLKKVCVAAVAP